MPPKTKDQPVLPAPEFAPPPCAAEIEAAARDYANCRDSRMDWGKRESEAYDTLKALLEFHNIKDYDFHGISIEIPTTPKVKVTVEEEPFTPSDPNQTAIDGTVHDDDEDEGLTPLAKDLKAIKDRADAAIGGGGEAA